MIECRASSPTHRFRLDAAGAIVVRAISRSLRPFDRGPLPVRPSMTCPPATLGRGVCPTLKTMSRLVLANFSQRERIHFTHLRNVKVNSAGDFCESGHSRRTFGWHGRSGTRLCRNRLPWILPPGSWTNDWGEIGKPGYGRYDRALGAVYLNGLSEALEKSRGGAS